MNIGSRSRSRVCVIAVVALLCGVVGMSPAAANTLEAIKKQLDGGNARGALRKADKLLTKVLALKVRALAKLGRANDALRSYEVLVALTQKESPKLLKAVAWAKLMQGLKSKDDKAKEMAAEALGELGDKRAVKPLFPLLRSKRFLARRKAAEALGKLGDKKAVKPLLRLLKDKSSLVKTTAAWSLAKLGNDKGLKVLTTCYKKRSGGSKLLCASLLAKLKKRSVLGYLKKELKSNNNRRARKVIAASLSVFGNSSWVKLVSKDITARNETSRLISVKVLGELKARRARKTLRKALGDRRINVRIAAAQSLGQLGSRRGTQVLMGALVNKNALVRSDAALALSFVKNRKTRGELVKVLSDRHLLVRVHAGHALVALGRSEGTGALREGMSRGNGALQVLSAKFAYMAAGKSRLKGIPVERMQGKIAQAAVTKAFEDSDSDALPGDDDDDDDKAKKPTARAAARTAPTARRPKARARTAPRRRAPPKRRGGDDDDDW